MPTPKLSETINPKLSLKRRMDEAEKDVTGEAGEAEAPAAPKKTGMTQYEFGGTGKMTEAEKARKAKGLSEALRKRTY